MIPQAIFKAVELLAALFVGILLALVITGAYANLGRVLK